MWMDGLRVRGLVGWIVGVNIRVRGGGTLFGKKGVHIAKWFKKLGCWLYHTSFCTHIHR